MTTWLYVDESGPFEGEEGPGCVVGGLLLGRAEHPVADAWLRDALMQARPGVPWPPHAWLLDKPAARVLLFAAGHQAVPAPVAAACRALARHPATPAPADRLARGLEPSPSELVRLRLLLRDYDPSAWGDLERLVRAQESAVLDVFGALGQHDPAARVVAAVAPPHDAPVRVGALLGDRWLGLLEVLLERVALLAAAGVVPSPVRVRVMTRRVHLPGGVPLDFQVVPHLGALTRGYAGRWPPRHGVASVRLVPWGAGPERRNEGLHPRLALADHVANRIWRARLERRAIWPERELLVAGALGPREAPVACLQPLPGLAVPGAAREAVRRGEVLEGAGWWTEMTAAWAEWSVRDRR